MRKDKYVVLSNLSMEKYKKVKLSDGSCSVYDLKCYFEYMIKNIKQ